MEDFVTFDLAKKLKEKGFPQHWSDNDYIVENEYEDNFEIGCYYNRCFIPEHIVTIAAPTIYQVLKWLREEKRIHICIDIYDDGWFFDIASFHKEDTGVYEIKLPYMSSNVTPVYHSFEQAALAGIEYAIDNLM